MCKRDEFNAELCCNLGLARRVARSCGVRNFELDDFVQDVLTAALQRFQDGAFIPSADRSLRDAVRAWLTGLVRFKALDFRRAMAVRSRVMLAGSTLDHPIAASAHGTPSPETQANARQELAAVWRLRMSDAQRLAVGLAAYGHTAREIGERLGIPEDTAATYIKRARKAYDMAKRRCRSVP